VGQLGHECNPKSELDGDLTAFCLSQRVSPLFEATDEQRLP